MGLEKNHEHHYRDIVDKFVDPSDNYTMNVWDYVVRPIFGKDPITITLPRVSEAKGRIYSILARSGGGENGGGITVTDQGDSEQFPEDLAFAAPGDGVVLYSDGLAWRVLSLTIST